MEDRSGTTGTMTPASDDDIKHHGYDIAVVGMGINVAGADNVQDFWHLMIKAESQHIEVPQDRFKFQSTNWREVDPNRKWYGNFIKDYDAFDHKFFKKSPREALYADPQHRLFLQCAYQAVEQSGYFNRAQRDTRLGVYVGVGSAEYEANYACHAPNAFSATGILKSAIPGRVSHFFGWTGPGLAIDTACSASAVALDLGCRAILSEECSAALIGGTQMLTSPFHYQNLAAASFLNSTGPCKPFDACADGYCRGEGIGAVFLKKLSQAVEDGDTILGCIASTAVLQNSSITPMFVPNADSLAELLEPVVTKAGLLPQEISMVEAHGTGTRVGDPAEYQSIVRILSNSAIRDTPLPVCSVKSLVGHTECASGIISLIKILTMINKGRIPLQTGFRKLSPELGATKEDMIELPKYHMQWDDKFRAALVNSFGASGSNSAFVVTTAPLSDGNTTNVQVHSNKYPFWISGHDDRSLIAYAIALAKFIRSSGASVADISFNLSRQSNRTLPKSVVFHATTRSDLLDKLDNFGSGGTTLKSITVKAARSIILCFGGQIARVVSLSSSIYDSVPTFRKHLDDCDHILTELGAGSIYPEIFQESPIEDTVKLQTSLFSLQFACAKTWMDCGIEVAAIVGHSFGELTCLAISGVLCLQDALKAVVNRAELVRDSFGDDSGAMLAVDGNLEDVKAFIQELNTATDFPAQVNIACFNGPTSFTVAGPSKEIEFTLARLPSYPKLRGIPLSVSNAFHSALVNPLIAELKTIGEGMTFSPPMIRWERATQEPDHDASGTDFFAKHMREPVHANEAFQRLHRDFPSAIWIEAGSKSTIASMAKKALGAPQASYFQSLDLTDLECLTDASVSLWREGVNVHHWLHRTRQNNQVKQLLLPPYQFEKTRHWLELKEPATQGITVEPQDSNGSAKDSATKLATFAEHLGDERRSACFKVNTTSKVWKEAHSGGFVAQRTSKCPTSIAIRVALESLLSSQPQLDATSHLSEIQNLTILKDISKDLSGSLWLNLRPLDTNTQLVWAWEIYSTDSSINGRIDHIKGEFEFGGKAVLHHHHELARYQRLIDYDTCLELLNSINADEIVKGRSVYSVLADVTTYSEAFKGLTKVVGKGGKSAAHIEMKNSGHASFDPYLSDCFLQTGFFYVNCMTDRDPNYLYRVTGFDTWIKSPLPAKPDDNDNLTWDIYATHVKNKDGGYITDVFVFDSTEKKLTVVILGVRFEKTSKSSVMKQHSIVGPGAHSSKAMQDYALAATTALTGVPSAQFTNPRNKPTTEDIQVENAINPNPPTSNTAPMANHSTPDPAPDQSPNDSIRSRAMKVISALSGVEESKIRPTKNLVDIGIDSLVEIELVHDLQKEFNGINPTDNAKEWRKVVSVEDLICIVEKSVSK